MKYKDWIAEWLAVYVKPTAKERTYEKYERICRKHLIPRLGQYEIETLSADILQRQIADLGVAFSPNTVNGIITVLKNSLKKAVRHGAAARAEADLSRPRASEKKIECFTQEEQRQIEEYILKWNKKKLGGILLCLYTGLRIGELMALTWEDIDFTAGMLSVTKSCHDGWGNGYRKVVEPPKTESSVRLIPIPKQLLDILKDIRRDVGDGYVVGGDKPVSVRSYQRTFDLLQKRLHLRHRGFHALRHTFATRAIECGMDVRTLSELLGHKDPTVTLERYVHSLMEHKQRMMARLGELLQ